jgi:cobalamin biosynthesis protein CobT
MDTVDTGPAAPEPAPKKHRNPWIWISGALAIAAIGLLVWALTVQSDLDDTNAELDQVQAQVQDNADSGGDFAAAAKVAYDELANSIGAAGEDAQASIEETQAQVDEAEQQAQEAGQQAAAAASDGAEQLQAETDEAKAQADAAAGKASIAAECAKAYVSAFGALFEGGSLAEGATAVREQISGITDDCQAALSGS